MSEPLNLIEKLDQLASGASKWGFQTYAVYEAIKRMEADAVEIARLRDALRSIAANTCCDECREAALVARAALDAKP